MNENTELLLKLSAALYSLGIRIEKIRRKVEEMVLRGCDYESEELKQLVKEYKLLQCQFASLEAQYQQVKEDSE